ncbi:MAG: h16 [Noviherbaspirillum sp.]|nr:h16 [Noviherbaspirillum sp.]MDB5795062.1 h16 [Noviherbaspirillum sp.]
MLHLPKYFMLGALCWSAFVSGPALGQNQPSGKPLRFIVITAAGGGADQTARVIAERLGPKIGRTIIVENRPGAGGNIASQYVAHAAPDGLTFLVTSNNHTINPVLYKNAGYDAHKDFVPVVQMARGPTVIAVHPSLPVQSMSDLVALSKSNKPLNYGSIGLGSAAHLVGECLKSVAGAGLEHITYKGGAPAVADAVAGHISLVMSSTASTSGFIRSGRLKPLAVSTAERWPSNPDVPTLAELGWSECNSEAWIGLLAPRGTPPAIVESMNREIAAVLKVPENSERIVGIGYLPGGAPASTFAEMLRKETAAVTKLIKDAGIQVGD